LIRAIALLIALVFWAYPHPVASKTEEPPTETKAEITNQEPYGPIRTVQEESPRPVHQPVPKRTENMGSNQAKQRSKAVSNEAAKPLDVQTKISGRNYSKEEVQALIVQYSQQYGIDSAAPMCIARLESGFNQYSKNRSSSAAGVFQYLSGTWRSTDEGRAGGSVYDAELNVKAAIKYMASRKSTQPWEVRNKCPKISPL
jgi:soluble lytic murein transglycosylase-like protein